MPGRPQVSIRMTTDGKAQVARDFVDVGDVGEAQAKRYQATWEKASAAATAAIDREAKAAERLAAVTATPVQQRINQATGVGADQSGNARASAAALAQQLEQAEKEARQLIASIDPLFAATARYEAQVERINAVKATGQLDEARYQQLLANEKRLLDEATAAGQRNAGMRGQMRMGAQQLGFQMNDVASQLAMGTRASVIFAQQSAQVVQALQLMGGEGNAFLRFLGGPWGIALSVAVVALTPFIGKIFEAGQSIDDLVEKLKKEAQQQADNARAHQLFMQSLEGVEQTLRDLTKAYDDYEKRLKTTSEQELDVARAALKTVDANRAAAQAALDRAKAELALNNALAIGPETKGHVDPRLVAADKARADIDAQQAALDRAGGDAAAAQLKIDQFQAIVTAETASEDKLQQIKRHYDELVNKAEQRAAAEAKVARAAGDTAKATAIVTTELGKQVRALRDKQQAEEDAARDRDRKAPKNAGGTAIFDSQISAFFDIASKYRGLSETKDRATLKSFLGDVDPEKTAWCAAFVNAVLAQGGVTGTGSLAAKSFLNFGKDDTKSPQRGDIAVVKTGVGDHVGFVDSVDKGGNVRMLGGNTGDKVGEATYSKNQVLAIRRPPTPSESAASADKAASDAITQQQAFDSESQKLNQQYLQALGKVVAGYDAQASVQLMRAQGEHDAEAKEIAANLAAGKYGDATSDLAQKRAQQLQDANDQVLSERKAAVALDGYVKSLQARDDENERTAKFTLDEKEYQQSIAKTAGERRQLGNEIIEIEYKEKEEHLKYLKYLAELNGNTKAAADAAAELANLPAEKARAKDQNERSNKNPLETYRDSLPANMADAGEAMQNSLVSGLKSLNDGLTDALMKSKNFHDLWKNMKSVFHDTAQQILKDLIDLTIKMFIIRPIMNLITGAPAFATGTEYFSGGSAWVGEHGPELVRLPRGSKISPAAESRRMAAANDAMPAVSVTNYNDFRGASSDAVGELSQRVDQMESNLPGTIASTMKDVHERTFGQWRGGR